MTVKALVLLALSHIPAALATGADIVAALEILTNNWEAVGNTAPPGTLVDVLLISRAMILTQNATSAAINVVENTGPFPEADGGLIFSGFQKLCSTVVPEATHKLIADELGIFAIFPIGGVPPGIVQEVVDLDTSTTTLATRLVSNAPNSLKDQFNSAALLCEQFVHAGREAYE